MIDICILFQISIVYTALFLCYFVSYILIKRSISYTIEQFNSIKVKDTKIQLRITTKITQDNSLSETKYRSYWQTFRNCQQCYRKFQKARTIIKLDSK